MAQRRAELKRKTAETEIFLSLDLDGEGAGGVDSGVGFLNHMLELFKTHSGINPTISCPRAARRGFSRSSTAILSSGK